MHVSHGPPPPPPPSHIRTHFFFPALHASPPPPKKKITRPIFTFPLGHSYQFIRNQTKQKRERGEGERGEGAKGEGAKGPSVGDAGRNTTGLWSTEHPIHPPTHLLTRPGGQHPPAKQQQKPHGRRENEEGAPWVARAWDGGRERGPPSAERRTPHTTTQHTHPSNHHPLQALPHTHKTFYATGNITGKTSIFQCPRRNMFQIFKNPLHTRT